MRIELYGGSGMARAGAAGIALPRGRVRVNARVRAGTQHAGFQDVLGNLSALRTCIDETAYDLPRRTGRVRRSGPAGGLAASAASSALPATKTSKKGARDGFVFFFTIVSSVSQEGRCRSCRFVHQFSTAAQRLRREAASQNWA